MTVQPFESPISELVWSTRYRWSEGKEEFIQDSWQRVAKALAAVEGGQSGKWSEQFYRIFDDFRFLPGGRILAGAGSGHDVTLFNCFVMGPIGDDMGSIFDSLKEAALTMQQGGGVGCDFSTLRPEGTQAHRVGGIASGPVSFMRIWDSMCATLVSTGARRGAMMGTLRCDHPDIEGFIEAKRDPRELRNFNLSVLISDEFMQAVKDNRLWPLVYPASALAEEDRKQHGGRIRRQWSGASIAEDCVVFREIQARQLWDRLMWANYEMAEPGVLFIDRINRENNLSYSEKITATNPCGEIPLPPYGACNLGSINLTRFVDAPFTDQARLDHAAITATAQTAVRLLDNVIDASRFPLPAQAEQARGTRRIGLGITGLADALIMLGIGYGSAAAGEMAAAIMGQVCHAAYRASIELAREKGAFPWFDKKAYLASPFVQRLPEDIRLGISKFGIRNSHLTAIAPAGTISLLADNISSGVEPVFEFKMRRRLRDRDGVLVWHDLNDYAWRHWQQGEHRTQAPGVMVTTKDLQPEDHLALQAAVQPFVDNAISKTINVPEDFPFERFEAIYQRAYELGLKGCTSFRPNPVTGQILAPEADMENRPETATHCCSLEREGD